MARCLFAKRGTKEAEMMTRAAGGILLTIILASAGSVRIAGG